MVVRKSGSLYDRHLGSRNSTKCPTGYYYSGCLRGKSGLDEASSSVSNCVSILLYESCWNSYYSLAPLESWKKSHCCTYWWCLHINKHRILENLSHCWLPHLNKATGGKCSKSFIHSFLRFYQLLSKMKHDSTLDYRGRTIEYWKKYRASCHEGESWRPHRTEMESLLQTYPFGRGSAFNTWIPKCQKPRFVQFLPISCWCLCLHLINSLFPSWQLCAPMYMCLLLRKKPWCLLDEDEKTVISE